MTLKTYVCEYERAELGVSLAPGLRRYANLYRYRLCMLIVGDILRVLYHTLGSCESDAPKAAVE